MPRTWHIKTNFLSSHRRKPITRSATNVAHYNKLPLRRRPFRGGHVVPRMWHISINFLSSHRRKPMTRSATNVAHSNKFPFRRRPFRVGLAKLEGITVNFTLPLLSTITIYNYLYSSCCL